GAEVELVAAAGEVVLQLAEGLVLLVADPRDGEVHRLADLGDGPAAGPELDDPVLAGGQDGLAGGLEDLAPLLAGAPGPGGCGGAGRGRGRAWPGGRAAGTSLRAGRACAPYRWRGPARGARGCRRRAPGSGRARRRGPWRGAGSRPPACSRPRRPDRA